MTEGASASGDADAQISTADDVSEAVDPDDGNSPSARQVFSRRRGAGAAQAPTSAAPASAAPSAATQTRLGRQTPPQREVLLKCPQPVIVSSVAGPPRITVGRPASYRVSLQNKGDEPAREMTASIAVPAWAEVVDAKASNGSVERLTSESGDNTVKWRLYELGAGASQTLTLELIPRSGQPLQLGVAWDHAPVSSAATVEVAEPKLNIEITGPAEVLYGKPQRYALTLSNPGTGDADDVVIELIPPGGNPQSPVQHRIGTMIAGAAKKIELELTAREAGELRMQAAAIAAGDLRTEAVKTVFCRKADLEVDWRGPDKNFAGAEAAYFFRVRNPGTATAEQVAVELTLPAGAEAISAPGHAWDAARRTVVWKTGSLAAGEERFMQLKIKLSQPGVNEIQLAAKAATGNLVSAKTMAVNVEALADLKLTISDPRGVVPVGDEVVYEVRVKNRGLTDARGVNVVAMFSEGIDPARVEGGQHEIRDGRVSFRTIDALPAGGEAVLRIHAKASREGTHIFRTEVVCDDLETKLAAEETTRFFVEEHRWADASTAYASESAASTK